MMMAIDTQSEGGEQEVGGVVFSIIRKCAFSDSYSEN